jgi:hypothetical protein
MIPPVVMRVLVSLAMLTGMTLEPVMPEPMPEAMTAQAVLEPAEDMVEQLAIVIYQEAGGDACSDKCRMYVGDVVLNRMASDRFPNTLEEVLTQKHQYGTLWKTGIVWPSRASNPGEASAVERAYETARKLLSGEHSEIYGEGYVWQAEFPQGSEGFWCDGMYFGK